MDCRFAATRIQFSPKYDWLKLSFSAQRGGPHLCLNKYIQRILTQVAGG